MISYQIKNSRKYQSKPKSALAQLKSKYLDYCESQKNLKVYWYMKVIIVLTCVFMVPSITLMAIATDYYVYYVGLTMILFYTNVVGHLIGLSSKFYIPLYHFTCILMILIPIITLMIFGANGTKII